MENFAKQYSDSLSEVFIDDNVRFISSRTKYRGKVTVDPKVMQDQYGEPRQYNVIPFYALSICFDDQDGNEQVEQAEIVNYESDDQWTIYTETEGGFDSIMEMIR
tara:strand:- start:607 stop:921 length:315 start_codon:yes stop_codon:yes gene_type:complete